MARGGRREGAGRPAGSENRDTAALRAALADRCGPHVETAITALADIATSGLSEAARVSAACAILDRTYGRPRPIPEADDGTPEKAPDTPLTREELEREIARRGLPIGLIED